MTPNMSTACGSALSQGCDLVTVRIGGNKPTVCPRTPPPARARHHNASMTRGEDHTPLAFATTASEQGRLIALRHQASWCGDELRARPNERPDRRQPATRENASAMALPSPWQAHISRNVTAGVALDGPGKYVGRTNDAQSRCDSRESIKAWMNTRASIYKLGTQHLEQDMYGRPMYNERDRCKYRFVGGGGISQNWLHPQVLHRTSGIAVFLGQSESRFGKRASGPHDCARDCTRK